ncbi:MAG: hypothetical protein ACRD4J_03900 [Nitrososphaeraceae archaeon]
MDRGIERRVMGSAIFASFVVISAVLMATYPINHVIAYPYGSNIGEYDFGTISSVQNDENGNPGWVLFGNWKSNLANNQSLVEGQGNETLAGESFDTQFEMVRLNGSEAHTHTITNFVDSNSSQINDSTMMVNGTATASMREGPVTDIPSSVTITGDKVISIWLDPSKINNHYGNTPIYGLVMDDNEDRNAMLKSNSTQIGR